MGIQAAAVSGILAGLGVLWYKSRKEVSIIGEESSSLLQTFEKMAVWIRKHMAVHAAGEKPGERQVRRSIMILYPDRKLQEHQEAYYVRKLRNVLIVVFAGTVLSLFCILSALANPLISDDGSIKREGYNGEAQEVSLTVRIKGPKEERNRTYNYSFSVGARRYSRSELKNMAASLEKEIPEKILGENRSLAHVTKRLRLPSKAEGYPFSIRWESSEYATVDSDGSVDTGDMKYGETREVVLTAILTYDSSTQFELEIPVTVEVPKPDRAQTLRNDIQAALEDSEQKTARESRFFLPLQVDGIDLIWTQKPDMTAVFILGLAAGAAVAVWFAADEKLHRTMRGRKHQMEIDYPGILNRMVLYLGAGMSVRNVFFRLGSDYRLQRSRGGERRYAYDEILLVCRELESGQSETEAYTSFGSRCGMGQYTKLCTILIRNLRKGNSVLLSVLQAEVQEATLHRRNLARELGEKAGTKMLFPMVVMLAVTMILIIVPAYFGFSL